MRSTALSASIAIVALCFGAGAALAGDGQGKIVQIAINKDFGSAAFIRLDSNPTGVAACSTHGFWHFTFPLVSDLDKRMHAQLVAAKFAGTQVTIAGTGSCNEFGSVESAKGVGIL